VVDLAPSGVSTREAGPESWRTVNDAEELASILGAPSPVVSSKSSRTLGPLHLAWLANSPLCLMATSDASGACDVSPRGDPPGFALSLGPTTLALPERPGNRRADSLRNILSNPRIGLIFLVPGRPDTLRINGRAKVVRDAPFFERMRVRGHTPALAVVVEAEEVYFHCGKSLLRAGCWDPESWRPEKVPSRALIAKATEWTERSMAELEERYGPAYLRRLYG
jgi:PPOX class probable FMN-dependent enzyme